MGSYTVRPFVSGFFQQCFQGSSIWWHVSGLRSFLWLSSIPLCGWTTFCSLISCWTLGSFPPFGSCESCCCEHACTSISLNTYFSVLSGLYLGAELLGLCVFFLVVFFLSLSTQILRLSRVVPCCSED